MTWSPHGARTENKSHSPDGEGQFPCWSPNGKWIAWSHLNSLWLTTPQGTQAHVLTNPSAKSFEYCGGWSSDSQRIVYLSADSYDASNGGPYYIWTIQANGKDQKRLGTGIHATKLRWPLKGNSIYYSTADAIMNIDISGNQLPAKVAFLSLGYGAGPSFDISSDGHWLVYDTSGPENGGNIFKMDLRNAAPGPY